MTIKIDGLKLAVYENEEIETEDFYYFNRKMLEDGVFIRYNTMENPENDCIDSYLEVACLSDNRGYGGYFILYWQPMLSGIEVYRMIKDIYELYLSNPKKDFIDILMELSVSYRDSLMEGRGTLISKIEQEIETIKQVGL